MVAMGSIQKATRESTWLATSKRNEMASGTCNTASSWSKCLAARCYLLSAFTIRTATDKTTGQKTLSYGLVLERARKTHTAFASWTRCLI